MKGDDLRKGPVVALHHRPVRQESQNAHGESGLAAAGPLTLTEGLKPSRGSEGALGARVADVIGKLCRALTRRENPSDPNHEFQLCYWVAGEEHVAERMRPNLQFSGRVPACIFW